MFWSKRRLWNLLLERKFKSKMCYAQFDLFLDINWLVNLHHFLPESNLATPLQFGPHSNWSESGQFSEYFLLQLNLVQNPTICWTSYTNIAARMRNVSLTFKRCLGYKTQKIVIGNLKALLRFKGVYVSKLQGTSKKKSVVVFFFQCKPMGGFTNHLGSREHNEVGVT